MGRVKKIEIKESLAELLEQSKKAKAPLLQARLRAYYLYKSGQCQAYGQIGAQLGYERHAVGKWFQTYQAAGLQQSLELKPVGGVNPGKIPAPVLAALQAKLQQERACFTCYTAIQAWLIQEHGVVLSYSRVHGLVRYGLKAKLKVMRKSNLKKDEAYEQKFKKK